MSLTKFRVRVHGLKGTRLAGKDNGGTSADPFLKFSFDNFKTWKTSVVKKTLNPEWPDPPTEFEYSTSELHNLRHKKLVIKCYDKDSWMKKDFIGSASLDLYTMATGPVKHVVALTDANRFAGELELKVEFQQISAVSVHIDEVDLSGITSLGRIPTQLELVSMFTPGYDKKSGLRTSGSQPANQLIKYLPTIEFRKTFDEMKTSGIQIRVLTGGEELCRANLLFKDYYTFTDRKSLHFAINTIGRASHHRGIIRGKVFYVGFPQYIQMLAGVHTESGITDAVLGAEDPPHMPTCPVSYARSAAHAATGKSLMGSALGLATDSGRSSGGASGHGAATAHMVAPPTVATAMGDGGSYSFDPMSRVGSASGGGGSYTPPGSYAAGGAYPGSSPYGSSAGGTGAGGAGGGAGVYPGMSGSGYSSFYGSGPASTSPAGGDAGYGGGGGLMASALGMSSQRSVSAHHGTTTSSGHSSLYAAATAVNAGVRMQQVATAPPIPRVDVHTSDAGVAMAGKAALLTALGSTTSMPAATGYGSSASITYPAANPYVGASPYGTTSVGYGSAAGFAGYGAAAPVAPPAAEILPYPWRSAVDPASGRTYYMNSVTRTTQWDKPV